MESKAPRAGESLLLRLSTLDAVCDHDHFCLWLGSLDFRALFGRGQKAALDQHSEEFICRRERVELATCDLACLLEGAGLGEGTRIELQMQVTSCEK